MRHSSPVQQCPDGSIRCARPGTEPIRHFYVPKRASGAFITLTGGTKPQDGVAIDRFSTR
jgi:hypothetical protein